MESGSEKETKQREQAETPDRAAADRDGSVAQPHRDVSGGSQGRRDQGGEKSQPRDNEGGDLSGQKAQPHRDISSPDRAGQSGREADYRSGSGRADRIAEQQEKAQQKIDRDRHASPKDGVGFRFNEKTPAPGEVDRYLKGLPEDKRKALDDPKTKVRIDTHASRPGAEGYNQRLTEERGEALKKELQDRGVKAQIEIIPWGEKLARKADQSPMSVKEPNDQDPEDRQDDPWDRTAKIEIQPEAQRNGIDPKKFEGQDIRENLQKGEQLFNEKLANTLGEAVRSLVPLEANPAAPDPARDPGKFASQAGEFIIEALSNPRKKVAEMAVGTFLEVTGVRDQMRKEVAKQREPLYEAIARGVSAALDPRDANWQPQSPGQKEFFQAAKQVVEGLSQREKEQLSLFLTQYATQWETSFDYLAPRMEGSSYREGVKRYFDSDKYFDRN